MSRRAMSRRAMSRWGLFTVAVAVAALVAAPAQAAPSPSPKPAATAATKATVVYSHLALPNGEWAQVYSDGLAEVHRGERVAVRQLPVLGPGAGDTATAQLPSEGDIIAELAQNAGTPYAAQQVVAIYRPGAAVPQTTLKRLGVDRSRHLFANAAQLGAVRTSAEQSTGQSLLAFENAYVLHLRNSSVAQAVATLRADPDVAYAAPDWTVSTAHTQGQPVPASTLRAATAAAAARPAATPSAPAGVSGVPTNYALTSSAQALLNRPGVDAVPAYTALAEHGQLPGQGEIITNVSLGTLTDASAAADSSDPCYFYASVYGPTTIVQNGQRYLDWPSMPLIPTYTADANGTVDPTGETCGDDPTLTEVGLDFSMMAPLPHDKQRPGAVGGGLTDLLGVAPGASYRLMLPKTPGGASTDVDAALLAAANQTPRPSVITASLGFGYDQYGFSARYFEDDPLTRSIVTTIVHGYHIVMCVSSGDGLRTFTNAAVSPSGGSVATEVAGPRTPASDLDDVGFSGAPSRDPDSGAIDVGGSTLDDIFGAPPGDPSNAALRAQHAFPATRYTGARNYSSGFGSRVNVSAPGDNVLSFAHPLGGAADSVQVLNEGGTSASAPETAAAAAVVLQVARLTHNSKLQDPLAVRAFLAQTGTPLPDPGQADQHLNVGPQIDLGRAVTTLLGAGAPGVVRVAVEQRQQASALGGTISTVTDPTNIPLTGRLAQAWITIAPDWVGLPMGATYSLTGARGVLATTPWARVQPADILGSVASAAPRTVSLTYTAAVGHHVLASTDITLTFGSTDGTVQSAPAPIVPTVVRGDTIPVHYDITGLTGAVDPILVVSQPGRIESATGLFFRPAFTAPLTVPEGTVQVPVSALPGAGIYGIGIQDSPGGWFSANRSTFAFTRVAPPSDAQPAPPDFSRAHYLEVPYHGSFQLSYDVSTVPQATGAVIEFSAPGPTTQNNYNPFNNPNGSVRDANGHDTGSVAFVPVSRARGTVTLNSGALGLHPTMNHVVRVLPTRNGIAVGEASGVSTISMDGVRAADGGGVLNGFGVDSHGGAGMLTSDQATATGTLASVERFDESTMQPTSTVVSSTTDLYGTIDGACAGLFHNGVGLYAAYDPSGNATFHTLTGGTWTPPAALGGVLCAAHNQDTSDTAVISHASTLQVWTSDIAANTFTQPVDLSPALSSMGSPSLNGFAQDTSAHQAVVSVNDGADSSAPAPVVTASFTGNGVRTIPGVTTGFSSGVAVDSATHQAMVGSYEGVGLYDLSAGTGTLVQPGGTTYEQPAADPTRGEFLVREVAPPDFFGGTPNNNAMSAVIVVDEHGTVLRRIEAFNFFRVYLLNMGDYLQLDPSSGTAYTLGPGGVQLFPFSYK